MLLYIATCKNGRSFTGKIVRPCRLYQYRRDRWWECHRRFRFSHQWPAAGFFVQARPLPEGSEGRPPHGGEVRRPTTDRHPCRVQGLAPHPGPSPSVAPTVTATYGPFSMAPAWSKSLSVSAWAAGQVNTDSPSLRCMRFRAENSRSRLFPQLGCRADAQDLGIHLADRQ